MRLGLISGLLSVSVLTSLAASAQEPPPASAAPLPPAAPPPPGYAPAPAGYAPQPQGYVPPPSTGERTANNSIYVEGLGPGLFYSVNYDRTYEDFAGRIGFGYVSVSASGGSSNAHASVITVPITVSYLGIGSKRNMFEVGAGATVVRWGAGASSFAADENRTANASDTSVWGTVMLGYRLQPPDGGFLLRAGLSPIIGAASTVIPWPYLSLGGCF